MDSVFGLIGEDFAIVAADATSCRSILVYKHDEDKILSLDKSKLLASSGPASDTVTFGEFIQKNLKLYEFDNDMNLNTTATANYIRKELAVALRKAPFQTNVLLAGFDQNTGASLYFIDYLASMAKVNFGAHGYCANFILSVFDREWKKGLNEEEGLQVIKKCIHELKTRFLINQPNFVVKLVNKDGIKIISL